MIKNKLIIDQSERPLSFPCVSSNILDAIEGQFTACLFKCYFQSLAANLKNDLLTKQIHINSVAGIFTRRALSFSRSPVKILKG